MKRTISLLLAVVMLLTTSAGMSFSANAAGKTGWEKVQEIRFEKPITLWYYYENGKKVTGWKQIKGTWYYFCKNHDISEYNGVMACDRIVYFGDNEYYFFDEKGAMRTGWISSHGDWYYGFKSGVLATEWQKINGKWYYFIAPHSAVMAVGMTQIDNNFYLFNSKGEWVAKPKNGWNSVKLSNGTTKWCYYKNGAFVKEWQKINGKWYYFYLENRAMMVNNILPWGDKTYYITSNGSMREKAGWFRITSDGETNWFYTNSKGELAKGWQKISGKWYYFYPEKYGSSIEYCSMVTGWLYCDSGEYYLDKDGAMVTGTVVIDGITCKFDSSGRCIRER